MYHVSCVMCHVSSSETFILPHLSCCGDLVVENVSRAYMVDISQRVFVEQDPANGCPNQEYLSYEE